MKLVAEYLYNAFRFIFPHQTMIYMYADELLSYRLNQHRCNYGRIYAA